MKYLIYKTTNLVNGKIYIGCHKTNDINDDYLGSGKILKRAIKKYGIENFSKEILQVFDNPEEMFEMESELVNEDFIKEDSNYNLKIGGEGGFDYINENGLNQNGGKYLKEFHRNGHGKYGHEFYDLLKEMGLYDACIQKHRDNMLSNWNDPDSPFNWNGKRHTEESKKKIGKANSINQKGKKNSQYGTMWIYNLELQENKKIKKEDFSSFEDLGWQKGRKMKW